MILKYISIDTNVLNYCLDNDIATNEVNSLLENNGYMPLLVPYVIYECAKCFVDKDPGKIAEITAIERGKKLFCYIQELKPAYSCRRDHLFKMECDKIKYGNEINFLAGVLLKDEIQRRVDNLCFGNITEDLKRFVLEREACLPLQRVNIFKPDNTKKDICKSSDFNNVREKIIDKYKNGDFQFINNLIEFVKIITMPQVTLTMSDIVKFANDSESYPALRSAIFRNLYLQYSSNKHGDAPSLDKFSDFSILAESSYCSAILTNETKLKEHFNQISPNICVMKFDELKRS